MGKEKIVVTHGSNKTGIYLDSTPGRLPTLQDLAEAIAQKFDIPVSKQKLICKGRTLDEYNATLADLGVSSKSKVMVLGKKNDPIEEKHLSDIEAISKQTEELRIRFEELKQQVTTLSLGYLDDEKTLESIKRLSKCMKGVAEGFMKNVETLDALNIDSQYATAKEKRRDLIKTINAQLTMADREDEKLEQMLVSKH